MTKFLMPLLGIALLAITSTTHAYPLIRPGMPIQSFPPTFTTNYNFEGIVSLPNCSGSLVRFEKSRDTDPAMVLTNGHCMETGFPRPGEVIYRRSSRLTFGLLNSAGQRVGTANATMIIYGTMTKTDMALYRLRETFADIQSRTGIRPLTMSPTRPNAGDQIEVISGYWKRGFTCSIESFAHQLKEGNWTCEDSMRYSQPGCETYGGTSGSPVVLAGTRTVVGVNNTGNESGMRCTENNPCEIDPSGNVTFKRGWAYGQQTYWVYSCLDSSNEIDLKVTGCLLPN